MNDTPFRYRKAKYVITDYTCALTPVTGLDIKGEFFHLHPDGLLELFPGFVWDGASGPMWDTPTVMRASAYHDVFCRLMRSGQVSYELWQDTINGFFELQCRGSGMSELRAKYAHWGTEFGDAGNPNQGPDDYGKVLEAP